MRRALALLLLVLLLTPAVASAAAPVVAASALTLDADTTDGNLVVNLPTGIAAGHTLIVCQVADGTSASGFTFPGGWTERYDVSSVSSHGGCGVRIADGSEGSTITLTIATPGSAEDASAIALRITGAHASSLPEVGTAVQASSTSPNPPSLTASWGAEDNLFIAVVSASSAFIDTNISAGYGGQLLTAGVSTQAVVSTATKAVTATATDDPGTWTLTSTTNWLANTIVVRPAAASTCAGRLALLGVGC